MRDKVSSVYGSVNIDNRQYGGDLSGYPQQMRGFIGLVSQFKCFDTLLNFEHCLLLNIYVIDEIAYEAIRLNTLK